MTRQITCLCLACLLPTSALALPDLQVQSMSSDPTSVVGGATTTVSLTVRNAGDAGAAATTARIYYSADVTITTADTFLADVSVDALAAGATSSTYNQVVTIPVAADAGMRYLGIYIDYQNTVVETSELNNTWNSAINVTALTCHGTAATDPGVCGGHGQCTAPDFCTCENGYAGTECNEPACDPPCHEYADCVDVNTCECREGFTGDGVTSCEETEECTFQADWTPCADGACYNGSCEQIGANDLCEDATALDAGMDFVSDLNGFHTFLSIPEACITGRPGGPDAWFTFPVSAGRVYTVSATPAAALDIALAAWEDCTLAAKNCLDGADSGKPGVKEEIEVHPVKDGSVIVQLTGINATTITSTSYVIRMEESSEAGDNTPQEDVVEQDSTLSPDIVADDADAMHEDAAHQDDAVARQDMTGIDTSGWDDLPNESDGGCSQSGGTPMSVALMMLAIGLFVGLRRRHA